MAERTAGPNPHTSVVIPVHNKWELTEACLRFLAATLAGQNCEIIVVDNASSDATREACPVLGKALFGDFFLHHRVAHNCNFGPASNLGARMARGDFVLFLNNDTLGVPGYEDWHARLVRDFSAWPDVAATGPALLFPPAAENPLGAAVQHLGVFLAPNSKVGHLYEGIPADSPLAAKRRFFQIITAACMLMPRALFLEHNGFDEGYANGFEDVDLCARLCAAGWRMTVNPEARLYHLTSQTPGRHTHEAANFRRLTAGGLRLLAPDWHRHVASDGLDLHLTEWQRILPCMKARDQAKLAPLLTHGDADALADAIRRFPLWHEGYAKLADLLRARGNNAGAHMVLLSLAKLRPTPETLLSLLQAAVASGDNQTIDFAFNILAAHAGSFDSYMNRAVYLRAWAEGQGLDDLAGQLRRWSARSGDFRERTYLPFLRHLRAMTRSTAPSPFLDWAYTLWRELDDLPERERRRHNPPPTDASIAFSVLMPVYNPEPEHLREAVDSLLAQDWPHWELCLADDASPDPRIRPLLLELAARDPRIRVEFRQTNGHIAAATNTALGMARHAWSALMDQDDTLSPDALREVAAAITARPEGLLFYSDEDKLHPGGAMQQPHFKKDAWDRDLVLGENMVSHLGVYRTDRLRAINGFRDGFPGSQDHEMLLRYVEDLDETRLVHIPKVLYHWRVHPGSTAAGIGAKPEALDSALRAITEHLQRKGVAGRAELVSGMTHYRVRYDLPASPPLVSLVVDLGGDCRLGRLQAETLPVKAGYGKLEILLLYDEEAEPDARNRLERWMTGLKQVRALPVPRRLSFGERANLAVAAGRGKLTGFMGRELVPASQDWLAEIVSRLVQPGVGVVGGKLITPTLQLHHMGHLADAKGRLFSLSRGLPAWSVGYFGWAVLAHTVRSVDPRCLFTHKELIEKADGFAPDMGGASAMDLCLRLGEQGLRTVVTPFAKFQLVHDADAPWENESVVCEPAFLERWSGRIAPCHPNLTKGHDGWTLFWNEED